MPSSPRTSTSKRANTRETEGPLYAGPPDVAEGFAVDDYEEEPVKVWPEHERAVGFFMDYCQTQWRAAGMGGYTGLDYTAVLASIQFDESDKAKAKELFEHVRGIERGALEEMADQARRAQKK